MSCIQVINVEKPVKWNTCIFIRADTLFILWNKYEPRLPPQYYQEKLLEIGDFLVTTKVSKSRYGYNKGK